MNNILQEGLPTEYKGYLLNTDFRVGIEISNILASKGTDDDDVADAYMECLYLLMGKAVLYVTDADVFEVLHWFLNGGTLSKKKKKAKSLESIGGRVMESDNESDNESDYESDMLYDFVQDSERIYSAFYSRYHIDLATEDMHWFKFLALLADLRDCSFTDVMGYRGADLSQYEGKEKELRAELKRQYRLHPPLSKGYYKHLKEQYADLGTGDSWEEIAADDLGIEVEELHKYAEEAE